MRLRNLSLLFLFILASCGAKKEDPVLKEAYELQQKVIKAMGELEEIVEALPEAKHDSLHHIIHEMEENLFAIPGYELNLPGHEGHDHSHGEPNMTNDQMLAVQKEMLQEVQSLKKALENNE